MKFDEPSRKRAVADLLVLANELRQAPAPATARLIRNAAADIRVGPPRYQRGIVVATLTGNAKALAIVAGLTSAQFVALGYLSDLLETYPNAIDAAKRLDVSATHLMQMDVGESLPVKWFGGTLMLHRIAAARDTPPAVSTVPQTKRSIQTGGFRARVSQ